jgi:hypothetical protein
MRKTAMLVACLLFTGAQAQEWRVGDTLSGEIWLGNAMMRRTFPLPAGNWRVLRVRHVDGTRTGVQNNQALPRSIEVVLAQVDGQDLVMMMSVRSLREQTAVRRWTNADPCEEKERYLHSNSYDSTVHTTKCLVVQQTRGFLGANTSYPEVRDWVAAEKLRAPNAPLVAHMVRFGDYHSMSVRFWANPLLRKLDARNETEFRKYADEFIAWSESYMQVMLAGSPRSIAAFR